MAGLLLFGGALACQGPLAGGTGDGNGAVARWVYGYWAVWQANRRPIANIGWSDMTHCALGVFVTVMMRLQQCGG